MTIGEYSVSPNECETFLSDRKLLPNDDGDVNPTSELQLQLQRPISLINVGGYMRIMCPILGEIGIKRGTHYYFPGHGVMTDDGTKVTLVPQPQDTKYYGAYMCLYILIFSISVKFHYGIQLWYNFETFANYFLQWCQTRMSCWK